MMKMKDTRGFSLIEVIMAFVILIVIMTSVLNLFADGTRAIAKVKIDRQVSECATLLMEYLGTIPPDMIFSASPGNKITSDFNTDEAFYSLKAFIESSVNGQKCVDLSADLKTKLQFEICPSCEYGCVGGAPACSGVGASAQCIYDLTVRFSWDSPFPNQSTGRPNKSIYRFKRFTNTMQDCMTAGCPAAAPGEGLDSIDCTL